MVVVARGEFTVSTLYDGVDGVADKFFRAWADSANGATNFSKTDSNRSYLGTFVGLTEPTSYTQYAWTKVKGENGESSVVAVLDNDSHTIPTDVNGANGNYTGARTQIKIYEGGLDQTSLWTITAVASTGVAGSLAAGVYTVTSLTVDTGYVDFTAKKGTVTLTKRFTVTRVKTGASGAGGASATAYQLTIDKKTIKKDEKGVMTDAGKLTLNAISQTGTAAPVAYAGRFIIQEQVVQGSTWVTKYTSSANQSTYTYTVSADALQVKISLYLAGGTTSLIDTETVAVISDGITPLSLVITTPKGDTIRNSTGNLTAQATLFKAGTEVTTATYKWYEMVPTGTGDADSGAGWSVLSTGYTGGTSGFTTNTLTITPAAIKSSATFMVIVTFEGLKYRNSVTVSDITDPIIIQILGPTSFRNGRGSVQLTAKVYRSGVEIDPLGNSGYVYQWNYYTPAGAIVSGFSKVGKTVTIAATEIANIADIRCTVSD